MRRPVPLLLCFAALAAGGCGASPAPQPPAPDPAPAPPAKPSGPALLAGIPQSGFGAGRPSAPVTVREFIDLRCPVCARHARKAWPALLSGPVRSGQARLTVAPWPVTGRGAREAALALAAAGMQGKAVAYALEFYAVQPKEGAPAPAGLYETVAAKAGASGARLAADMRTPAAAAIVRASSRRADRLKLPGTPALEISGPGGRFLAAGALTAAQALRAVRTAARGR